MGNATTNSLSGSVTEGKRHSFFVGLMIRLVREKPLGAAGAVLTLLLLFTGIFANFIAPYGVNEVNSDAFFSPPSSTYWLGTDNLGRDMLSRVIYGARVSVIVGLSATTIAVAIQLIIAITCGYFGGKFDLIVQRFVDGVMCLPTLILLMVIMSLIGTGMWPLVILMGVHGGIAGSRLLRSAVIAIRKNVYVEAAIAIGCPTGRILTHHILPNIAAPIIVVFSLTVPGVILTEASLSFLGFGIPPTIPSWGGMLSGSARGYMFQAPWMAMWPGLALSLVVYGINIFGDALRDLMDPRLRGGVGRYGLKVRMKPQKGD